MEDADNKLSRIRHSLAHLLAMAVLDKYPNTKLAIGPAIENGFYYDFDFPEGVSPTPDGLKDLQKHMRKLAGKGLPFSGKEISAAEARKIFKDEPYKLELIDEFEQAGEKLTTYTSDDFTDLCKGGHIENTKEIDPKAFKLTHIAGAYWRGDEKNKMLTRIYGVAFETKKELDDYLAMREEAKKRDHRKLGRELDLFTFSDLVGSGLPLFTPKGAAMRNEIIKKIHAIQQKFGYQNVWIPHIAKKELYITSGHWDKFKEDLFHVKGKGDTEFVMKPMNCPHHTQIYASAPRSYRDLPVRFSEMTTNYRDEQPGELLGLSRVRSLTQDDGHVFCSMEQIKDEIKNVISVIREFYTSLDMFKEGDYWVSLSVRDPAEKEKYLGDEKHWEEAEKILSEIVKEEGLDYKKIEGEAAFYGPKLDFMFKDALGREWQLATVQLDFVMPERFGLTYKDKDNTEKTPVMIHRAIAGSLERFMSVIIEHFAGAFPLWISPVQVWVLPIGEGHKDYAEGVYKALGDAGIRAELHDENETLGKKIREAKQQKIPYFLVIGDEEVNSKQITLESRDHGKIGQMSVEDLLHNFAEEIRTGKRKNG
ncbi:MAG: threonine--tRNA ligase [Patescibacteria group bacterium]|nr:MAG: threonine--tRNA ligase [Patescibacteria group bacterium]